MDFATNRHFANSAIVARAYADPMVSTANLTPVLSMSLPVVLLYRSRVSVSFSHERYRSFPPIVVIHSLHRS